MAPIQTTYNPTMEKGVPGLVQGSDWDADTGIVETEAGIGFGLPVTQGAGEKGIVLAGAIAGFRGVTIRDIAQGSETDEYARYKSAAVLKRGKIFVTAGADGIVPGDPVHYNSSTGAWLKSGGVGPIPHARWASAGDTGDLVLLELYGTNYNGSGI